VLKDSFGYYRSTLSPAAVTALAPLKEEKKWSFLENGADGPYIVISSTTPNLVLDIGKKWTQVIDSYLF
jgi:hypothetical protein